MTDASLGIELARSISHSEGVGIVSGCLIRQYERKLFQTGSSTCFARESVVIGQIPAIQFGLACDPMFPNLGAAKCPESPVRGLPKIPPFYKASTPLESSQILENLNPTLTVIDKG
jgi:hypothetical protein